MQALTYQTPVEPFSFSSLPIPTAEAGSATVRIVAALLSPNVSKILSSLSASIFQSSAPFTIGAPAIGRIHCLGPDYTSLAPGQLVFADFHIISRDANPPSSHVSVSQGFARQPGDATANLAAAWPHGALAEYACVPLENVYPLDEELLLGRMSYTIPDLLQMADCLSAIAGLMDACELRPGDTVIVAPSTGRFSGCIVQVALAMGARVVAAGRTRRTLSALKAQFMGASYGDRLRTVALSGDEEYNTQALRDAAGSDGADAFVDMSPWGADVKHIVPAIKALRYRGKAAFLGGDIGMVELPYAFIMTRGIRVQGSCMFERRHVLRALKLVERGVLKVGRKAGANFKVQAGYKLTDIEVALKSNESDPGWGNIVVVEP